VECWCKISHSIVARSAALAALVRAMDARVIERGKRPLGQTALHRVQAGRHPTHPFPFFMCYLGRLAGIGGSCVRAGSPRVQAGSLRVRAGSLRVRAGSLRVRAGSLRVRAGSLRVRAGSLHVRAGSPRMRAGSSRVRARPAALNFRAERPPARASRCRSRATAGDTVRRWKAIIEDDQGSDGRDARPARKPHPRAHDAFDSGRRTRLMNCTSGNRYDTRYRQSAA